jgi:hypothetical protein
MDTPSSDQKHCPFCGETIMAVAVKCRHCGSWLQGSTPGSAIPGRPVLSQGSGAVYNFGKIGLCVGLLVGGFIALMLGVVFIAAGEREQSMMAPAVMFMVIGISALIAGGIYMFVLFYQIWKYVIFESRQAGLPTSIATPGQAIGYCFIPFYNFYWIFIAYGKLPKDLNALARVRGLTETMSNDLGMAIPILDLCGFIPFAGYLTGFVSFILSIIFFSQGLRMCKAMNEAGSRPGAVPVR